MVGSPAIPSAPCSVDHSPRSLPRARPVRSHQLSSVDLSAKVGSGRFGGENCPTRCDDPESTMGPWSHCLVFSTNAKGDSVPAWPPAPPATRIRPGTFLDRFSRKCLGDDVVQYSSAVGMDRPIVILARSSDVITIGTCYFTQTSRSWLRRSFDSCTIWLTAKEKDRSIRWFSPCSLSSVVIHSSHSLTVCAGTH